MNVLMMGSIIDRSLDRSAALDVLVELEDDDVLLPEEELLGRVAVVVGPVAVVVTLGGGAEIEHEISFIEHISNSLTAERLNLELLRRRKDIR